MRIAFGLWIIAGLAATGCAGTDPHEGHDLHDSHALMGHGLPNFCDAPTIKNISSGNWSDPSIWSEARVPETGDVVVVGTGTTVAYDRVSDEALRAVCIDGVMRTRHDVSTRLTVGTLQVMSGGSLAVGDESQPIAGKVTAEIVIADQSIDTTHDPEQFGTGFVGTGKVLIHGSPRTPTFVRLAAAPLAGATTLQLSEAPTDWQPGDRLVIPDTRQTPFKKGVPDSFSELEEVTVASIAGSTVSLTAPLAFAHAGELDLLPHAANLTRNVIVRSASPSATTRGHVMFTGRANVDIRYAAFRDLGRTTVDMPNSTAFDADGNVLSIGTNQIGRYSLHLHHLHGPENPANTGYQYKAIGNVIEGGRKWGVTIHQTHFGLVTDNVAYDIQGAGFATEDGNEAHNEIVHNFAVRIVSPKGGGSRGGISGDGTNPAANTGFAGDGFWNRGPHNYLRDNVAANTSFSGFNYNGYYLRKARIPKVRGADPEQASLWLQYSHQNIQGVEGEIFENIPLLESTNNEVYAMPIGMWITWPGATINVQKYVNESVIDGFTAWHIRRAGIEAYHVSHYTYRNVRLLNDPAVSVKNAGGARIGRGFALQSQTYENGKVVVEKAEVRGFNIGIDLPSNLRNDEFPANHVTRIEDAHLANYVNVADHPPSTQKRTELRRITFELSPMTALWQLPAQPLHVWMRHNAGSASRILRESSLVIEESNVPSMQVFFAEQHPDFVVPQSTNPESGYPVSGMTNEKGWATYGRAVCGQVLPAAAVTRPDIQGYALMLQ